jgi:amino acid permease
MAHSCGYSGYALATALLAVTVLLQICNYNTPRVLHNSASLILHNPISFAVKFIDIYVHAHVHINVCIMCMFLTTHRAHPHRGKLNQSAGESQGLG